MIKIGKVQGRKMRKGEWKRKVASRIIVRNEVEKEGVMRKYIR